jgi:hypothetical protein
MIVKFRQNTPAVTRRKEVLMASAAVGCTDRACGSGTVKVGAGDTATCSHLPNQTLWHNAKQIAAHQGVAP